MKKEKKTKKPVLRRVGVAVSMGDRVGRIIAVSGDDVGIEWHDGKCESIKWDVLEKAGWRIPE